MLTPTTEEDAKQTVKRDLIRDIEKGVQKKWGDEHIWEVDAPESGDHEKFMVHFCCYSLLSPSPKNINSTFLCRPFSLTLT